MSALSSEPRALRLANEDIRINPSYGTGQFIYALFGKKRKVEKEMPKKKNLAPYVLSILSGVLLFVSGTQGSIGVYGIIIDMISSFVEDALLLSILNAVALILILLASLGGISVILGGYMIYKSRVILGKFIIGIGAGMGVPGLLLTLFTLLINRDISIVIAQHGIIGWTGIILSLIARSKAK